MKKHQGYEYRDIYVSLLRYLGLLSKRIAAKYNVPELTVVNLESYPDLAKLPEGDLIFISDWTLEVDGTSYGDIHDLLIGFSVVDDPMFMRMETIYMNELMRDVGQRKPCPYNIDIMDEQTNTVKGLLIFNPTFETSTVRVINSRSFKSAMVQLMSPQRLKEFNSGD